MPLIESCTTSRRIWIPRRFHELLQEDFCEIQIKQNSKVATFISKLSKDGRLVVPKDIAPWLFDGSVYVNFKPLQNTRVTEFRNGTKTDILAFVPEKTLSGFPILAIPKRDSIFVWYFASKGRPNSLVIKRHLGKELYRLLGYYRAEGGKPRLSKRRGREFSFTNKSLTILQDFLTIFYPIFGRNIIRATITFRPTYDDKSGVVRALTKMGISRNRISTRMAHRIRDFVVRLYIGSSLLSEIVDNAEQQLRKYIVDFRGVENCTEYLRGVLSGDGSIYFWVDHRGSMHSRLQIFEANHHVAKDFEAMLSIFGIGSTMKKNANKTMTTITAYLNWDRLLTILKFNLFPPKRDIVAAAIKKHKRFRSLRHLVALPQTFTSTEFRNKAKTSQPYASTWLRDRRRDGTISGDFENGWILTQKGVDVASVLSSL